MIRHIALAEKINTTALCFCKTRVCSSL